MGGARTGVFIVSTFDLVAESAARVDDFSSNMRCLLYRDENGLPGDSFLEARADRHCNRRPAPARHTPQRCLSGVGGKADGGTRADIFALATALVTEALDRGTVEFMATVGNIVPITMISRLIGFRDSNLDDLWSSAVNGTRLVVRRFR